MNSEKIRQWLITYAKKKNYSDEDAEDISHNYLLARLSGKKPIADHCMTDFMRKKHGDNRTKHWVDRDKKYQQYMLLMQNPDDPEALAIKKQTTENNLAVLTKREMCLIRNLLKLKTRKHVAKKMGLSLSSICQMIGKLSNDF